MKQIKFWPFINDVKFWTFHLKFKLAHIRQNWQRWSQRSLATDQNKTTNTDSVLLNIMQKYEKLEKIGEG